MKIIKLDAIDSTNQFLKEMALSQPETDSIIVVAKKQNKGRGQMGSSWVSESGKNLTFSFLKAFTSLTADQQFRISICTSLALIKLLEVYEIPDLKIKWPNDIMSGSKKVCGILIENILSSAFIKKSVVGIGLNVNQTNFEGLPYASSLKILKNKDFNLDKLLSDFVFNLESYFKNIETYSELELHEEYHNYLFKRNETSLFFETNGNTYSGKILGVNSSGMLLVSNEDGVINSYGLKEIRMQL